jgi:hypothetical protein
MSVRQYADRFARRGNNVNVPQEQWEWQGKWGSDGQWYSWQAWENWWAQWNSQEWSEWELHAADREILKLQREVEFLRGTVVKLELVMMDVVKLELEPSTEAATEAPTEPVSE